MRLVLIDGLLLFTEEIVLEDERRVMSVSLWFYDFVALKRAEDLLLRVFISE